MKRLVSIALLLLLLLTAIPAPFAVHSQGAPGISVTSVYILNRYGFAVINESVSFTNNGTSSVSLPTMTFGVGNLSSHVAAYNLTVPGGFTLAAPSSPGGPYTVSSGQSVAANGSARFVLSLLLDGVVSTAVNGSLQVLTLTSPSISTEVDTLVNVVSMPNSTAFVSTPPGLTANPSGTFYNYSSSESKVAPQPAQTSLQTVAASSSQDFNPLHVYYARRTISTNTGGTPLVTDTVELENMGTTSMQYLYVDLLAPSGTPVTVLTAEEPPLISPVTISLASGGMSLADFTAGYPNPGVAAGENFTITYRYPLGTSFYSVSGGQVTVNFPETPPIMAFVDSYTISLSLPQGASASQSAPRALGAVTPWQEGSTEFSYRLTLGWAIGSGVPAASVIFVLLLIGLFVSKATAAGAEETEEEESSTELASDMIRAFDEKTDLINGLWQEIDGKDPNEIDKAYFDGLRSRLDSFRSRALQRLNEVKQKSTSQKFSEVVNQIQLTEREVDRAAKDKLNLYQQYHLRQMRKEVYDRLLPQYTKRLERALNQLSDELHMVQREAKLL